MAGEKLEHRVRVRLGILHARLRARDERDRHGGDRHPDPRVPVSNSFHHGFRLILCHKSISDMVSNSSKTAGLSGLSLYSEHSWTCFQRHGDGHAEDLSSSFAECNMRMIL